jgi:hypothetical protein
MLKARHCSTKLSAFVLHERDNCYAAGRVGREGQRHRYIGNNLARIDGRDAVRNGKQ